ncbi:MAG: ATP-dependent zinc metalloprotease FtsH [Acidimicrobiia bacterium]|nr:ATP-dependent zinc metalloprotease FtsH [Acidimicrobiia bacterium]
MLPSWPEGHAPPWATSPATLPRRGEPAKPGTPRDVALCARAPPRPGPPMPARTPPPRRDNPHRNKPRRSVPRRTQIIAATVLTALAIAFLGGRALLATDTPAPEDVAISAVLAEAAGASTAIERVEVDDDAQRVWVFRAGDAADRPSLTATYPLGTGWDLVERLVDEGIEVDTQLRSAPSMWSSLLPALIPVLLLLAFLYYVLVRRGGMGGAGAGRLDKRRAGAVDVPATRFDDVAGVDEVVDELRDIAAFLHEPDRFAATGARMPRGVLLEGPPGTGKTLLARALAGEAGVPFFALAGSDFVETFVGVGASRVRQLFDKAREAGRAIIFIDEIDAVGKARASGPGNAATEEREGTLNALLVEMDGFVGSGIVVLAATNRADMLDPALLRPGRFDRRVTVPAPDLGGRRRILQLHLRDKALGEDLDVDLLARRTPGMTGAELEQLVNEAALVSGRAGRLAIAGGDVEEALQVSMLGRARRSASVTERDRRITAWHEAGHAVAALLQPAAPDPVAVTIVPRGIAGGVTWMDGSDDQFLTRSQANAQLVTLMAGRAAEERLLDGDFTSGAAGDYQGATSLAYRMVTQFGMSDLGVAFRPVGGLEGERAARVDSAVDEILDGALASARALLDESAALLEGVAELLLHEGTVPVGTIRGLLAPAA